MRLFLGKSLRWYGRILDLRSHRTRHVARCGRTRRWVLGLRGCIRRLSSQSVRAFSSLLTFLIVFAHLNAGAPAKQSLRELGSRYTRPVFSSSFPRPGSTTLVAQQARGLNFAPAVSYAPGGYATFSVSAADVNRDGKPDLVVANNNENGPDGTVAILLANSDGTFQTALAYDSGGLYADSVVLADVNEDGKPDIIVSNECATDGCSSPGTVGVLLGNGDGTFESVQTYSSGAFVASSVATADVNGDELSDLIVTNCGTSSNNCANGIVSVLLGNGDGSFQAAVSYGSGGAAANSVAIADINEDGMLDLVVANGCADGSCTSDGALGILSGNGDGTFQLARSYDSGGFSSSSVALSDVNGDKKLDVLMSDCSATISRCGTDSGVIAVLLGNGDGTFQSAITYNSGGFIPISISMADVSGDGKPDLVVLNEWTSSTNQEGILGILLGKDDGSFQPAVTVDSGGNNSRSVAVDDLNADGKPDLAVASIGPGDGSVTVLINSSIGGTTTSLVSSPDPSSFGRTVTFTGTVFSAFKGIPSGSVSFFDRTNLMASSSISSSGLASISSSTLAVGTHSIRAAYSGDTNFGRSTSTPLSQVVQGAIAQLSPTTLNFGNQTVGIRSTSQSISLTNMGNIALTVSIGVTGTNAADFVQRNNCGSSVAAGASCTISVSFRPTAVGSRTALLSISDNAPDSPQRALLAGIGVRPAVTFSPSSLSFATRVVFTSSMPKMVMLTNAGLGLLNISKIGLTGSFSQTNNCPSTLNPSASCAFSLTFTPTTIGSLTGSLTLTDNAPGNPQKLPLKGTGTYMQLTPTSLNFGNQPVGTKSLPKRITVSNKGSVTVTITGVSVIGLNAHDFSESNTCGTSIAAGASCFITVAFRPSAKGARSAALAVSDNGGGSPQKASLVGTGT